MILGQSMPCKGGGIAMYSAWLPRQGNSATFVCHVIGASSANLVFDVTVQHKNLGDDDSGATGAGSFSTISSTGTYTLHVSGLKELVRFQYVADSAIPAAFEDWVHFRMLNPNWESNASPTGAVGVA